MKKFLIIISIILLFIVIFFLISNNSFAFTTDDVASNNKPLYMDDGFIDFLENIEYYNSNYNFLISNSYGDHNYYQYCFFSSSNVRMYCTLNQQPYINAKLQSTDNNTFLIHEGWIHFENGTYTITSSNTRQATSFSCQGWVDSNYNHIFFNGTMYLNSSGNNIFMEYNPFLSNITLDSISITQLPTNVYYYKGDNINMDGAVVVASYSDGTVEEITDYTVSPTVLNNLGNQLITVTYLDKSVTFYVTVYENQSSSILDRIFIFFSNFFDNLFHIVVPTEEQFESIQDDFSNNILSKFNITAWSFDSYNLQFPPQNKPVRPPILHFNFVGSTFNFDTQVIVDFLNTPVSFGTAYTSIGTYGTVSTRWFDCL